MATSAVTADGAAELERQEEQTALNVLKVPAWQSKALTAWRPLLSDTPEGWGIQTPFIKELQLSPSPQLTLN